MTEFEKKLDEWTQWFIQHRNDPRDLVQEVRFMKRTLEATVHLLHLAARELRQSQGRHETQLYVPVGFNIKGDLTRFG